jgi:hypothetical protein
MYTVILIVCTRSQANKLAPMHTPSPTRTHNKNKHSKYTHFAGLYGALHPEGPPPCAQWWLRVAFLTAAVSSEGVSVRLQSCRLLCHGVADACPGAGHSLLKKYEQHFPKSYVCVMCTHGDLRAVRLTMCHVHGAAAAGDWAWLAPGPSLLTPV